jgi:hypothetical protein
VIKLLLAKYPARWMARNEAATPRVAKTAPSLPHRA